MGMVAAAGAGRAQWRTCERGCRLEGTGVGVGAGACAERERERKRRILMGAWERGRRRSRAGGCRPSQVGLDVGRLVYFRRRNF